MTDHICAHCGRPANLARREYQGQGQTRYHVGIWCAVCERFTLPWLKQTEAHKTLPIADVEGMVSLFDLLNPQLFK